MQQKKAKLKKKIMENENIVLADLVFIFMLGYTL